MVNAIGGSETAGKKLKSIAGWNNDGNGTDAYSFSALPGGGYYSGAFHNVGNNGRWWSATDGGDSYAYYWDMHFNNDGVASYYSSKSNAFSVRCVK